MNAIVFYCSIGSVIVSVVALIPVVQIVNRLKTRYLEVFLDMGKFHFDICSICIDNNNIRKLANKCEKFMNMIQDEGNEEIDSNDEELEEIARIDTEDSYSMSRRSKKKKAKNTIKNQKMFLIKFIIGMLIIEIYYFQNYFLQSMYLKKWHILGRELNMTSSISPYYWFSLNVQRELYRDPTRPILG